MAAFIFIRESAVDNYELSRSRLITRLLDHQLAHVGDVDSVLLLLSGLWDQLGCPVIISELDCLKLLDLGLTLGLSGVLMTGSDLKWHVKILECRILVQLVDLKQSPTQGLGVLVQDVIESLVEIRDLAAALQPAAVPILPAPPTAVMLVEYKFVCDSKRLRVQQLILCGRAVEGRRLRPGALFLCHFW